MKKSDSTDCFRVRHNNHHNHHYPMILRHSPLFADSTIPIRNVTPELPIIDDESPNEKNYYTINDSSSSSSSQLTFSNRTLLNDKISSNNEAKNSTPIISPSLDAKKLITDSSKDQLKSRVCDPKMSNKFFTGLSSLFKGRLMY